MGKGCIEDAEGRKTATGNFRDSGEGARLYLGANWSNKMTCYTSSVEMG